MKSEQNSTDHKATPEASGLAGAALLDRRTEQDYLDELKNMDTEPDLIALLKEYREGFGVVEARRKWLKDQVESMTQELRDITKEHAGFINVEGAIIFEIGKLRVGDRST